MIKYRIVEEVNPLKNESFYIIEQKNNWFSRWKKTTILKDDYLGMFKSYVSYEDLDVVTNILHNLEHILENYPTKYKNYYIHPVFCFEGEDNKYVCKFVSSRYTIENMIGMHNYVPVDSFETLKEIIDKEVDKSLKPYKRVVKV